MKRKQLAVVVVAICGVAAIPFAVALWPTLNGDAQNAAFNFDVDAELKAMELTDMLYEERHRFGPYELGIPEPRYSISERTDAFEHFVTRERTRQHELNLKRFQDDIEPVLDLRSALLQGVALTDSNLSRLRLQGAWLIGANLRGSTVLMSDFSRANLSNADLRDIISPGPFEHAIMQRVNLGEVHSLRALRGADLRSAVLQGTDLGGADLVGADLRDADLSSASFCGAQLHGADLRGA